MPYALIELRSCDRIKSFLDTVLSLPTGSIVTGFRVGDTLYLVVGGSAIMAVVMCKADCVREFRRFCFKKAGRMHCTDSEPGRAEVADSDVLVIYDVDAFGLFDSVEIEVE